MDLGFFANRFHHNLAAIESVTDVGDEQARWKPSETRWSLLEVMCHLLDEERGDFRLRIDLLLHKPGEKWPPIDPEGWVVERNYNGQNLAETRAAFREERLASVEWLRKLDVSDWSVSYDHPLGPLSAGDLLASWLAHDSLHLRQLARLHYDYVKKISSPYGVDYAGRW